MKPPKAKIALLRSIPGLRELGERDALQLSLAFDELRVSAGTVLASAGRPVSELVLIVKGQAALTSGNGQHLLGPGDFVGELALLGDVRHNYSVSAKTQMSLIVAARRSFATILEHPVLVRHLAKHLARRLQDAAQVTEPAETQSQPRSAKHRSTVPSRSGAAETRSAETQTNEWRRSCPTPTL